MLSRMALNILGFFENWLEWIQAWGAVTITIIFFINFVIGFVIIFIERKNPSATLAWLAVLTMLPGIGIFFYVMLSQGISRQRIFKLSKNEEYFARKALKTQIEDMKADEYEYTHREEYIWRDMIHLNQTYGGAYYTQDNNGRIITDGTELMESIHNDIENAKDFINFETYILQNDDVGKELIKHLAKKAQEGVEVRLLIDAVGGRFIFNRTLREFEEAGGRYAFFFKPKLRWVNLRLNYRNHRKLICIDGEIGYIGGFNIGKEYLGRKKKFGYWRDTHMRFTGGCIRDINSRFLLDWRQASKENIPLNSVGYKMPEPCANTGVQIVSCGPESSKEEIKRAYMKMITSAEKNVYIQSPYFIPDKSIVDSLKMAAQSGVDVRIMIPCKPDHMFVYWATYWYAGELMKSGVKIYVYDNGFLHAKVVVCDGEILSCGSANFDNRSFLLNFEANAIVYDSQLATQMEAIFEEDMKECHELTKRLYENRSIIIKIKENISRLLSDLL